MVQTDTEKGDTKMKRTIETARDYLADELAFDIAAARGEYLSDGQPMTRADVESFLQSASESSPDDDAPFPFTWDQLADEAEKWIAES